MGVEGRIQVRTYEDKDTRKTVWVTEVVGDRIEFIESKSDLKNTTTKTADDKKNNSLGTLGKEVPFDQDVPF